VSRLDELLEQHFDAALSEDAARELELLLAQDAQARDQFWKSAEWHAQLRMVATRQAAPEHANGRHHRFSAMLARLGRDLMRPTPLSLSVAAGILIAIVGALAAIPLSHIGQRDDTLIAARVFAARLAGTHEAVWAWPPADRERASQNVSGTALAAGDRDPQTLATNADLFIGDRLYLKSGIAEIYFAKGTKVVLEGPAELTIDGNNFCALESGKLVARIETQGAKGFAVRTSLMSIVDLGTEFGVVAARFVEVSVFQGQVEVSPTHGTSQAAEKGAPVAATTVSAGQTARIGPDAPGVVFQGTAPAISSFVRPDQLQERIAADYVGRVRALNPVAYWQMEEGGTSGVANAAGDAHRFTLRLSSGTPPAFTPGKVGKALRLRGPTTGDCAVVSDYPESSTGKISVAAWVMAESRPRWGMIASNWGHGMKIGQFHLALEGNDGDLGVHVTQANGTLLVVREGAGKQFPLSRWQHVAFVADGARIRLYRNAEEIASQSYDGTLLASPPAGMGIGCKLADDGATPVGMNWHGWIDELVIFHRALSGDEIQQLARISAGNP